mgnify:CR=1 FL=1
MIPVIQKAITKYIPNITVFYTDGTASSSNTYNVEWEKVKTLFLHRDCTIISDGNIRFENLENIIYNGFTLSFEGSLEFMFSESKFNGDISNWNVSKVVDMRGMFEYSRFNGDISKWNVENVVDMSWMFYYSKFNGNISNWNFNEHVDKSKVGFKKLF